MQAFSARYDAALALAARAHRDQLRKGTDLPYIAHPVHVSILLIRHGFSEDLAIAGLLHDVVEDTDTSLDLIATEFGADVARLVEAVSETKSAGGAELPWEQRKAEKLAHLQAAGPDVAALKAADAIHNLRSIIADLQYDGPAVWGRFKRGPEPTLGYYYAILDPVREKLGAHPIVAELEDAVAELARAAGVDSSGQSRGEGVTG
jgi:(p)ppGpp synthase/HD superfamily hydrolase